MEIMNGRSAIVFDLDGTLVDTAPAICAALNIMLLRRQAAITKVDDVRALISLGGKELVAKSLGAACVDVNKDLDEFRATYSKIPCTASDLFPNVVSVIQRMHRQGFAMGICTNKPQQLARDVLAAVGLAQYFCCVLGGDYGGPPKPSHEHLAAVIKGMAFQFDCVFFVGDSNVDAVTSHACGVPFIFAEFGYEIEKGETIHCDARIGDFSELPIAIQTIQMRKFA